MQRTNDLGQGSIPVKNDEQRKRTLQRKWIRASQEDWARSWRLWNPVAMGRECFKKD